MSFFEFKDLIQNYNFVNIVSELVSNRLNIKNDNICFTITKSFLIDLCCKNPNMDFINYNDALRFIEFSLDKESITTFKNIFFDNIQKENQF